MINAISSLQTVQELTTSNQSVANSKETSFSNVLVKALETVNTYQNESDVLTQKLLSGEDVKLHEVMIAAQKSSVVMQTALEVRNKAVEAYQEMMRMSI